MCNEKKKKNEIASKYLIEIDSDIAYLSRTMYSRVNENI